MLKPCLFLLSNTYPVLFSSIGLTKLPSFNMLINYQLVRKFFWVLWKLKVRHKPLYQHLGSKLVTFSISVAMARIRFNRPTSRELMLNDMAKEGLCPRILTYSKFISLREGGLVLPVTGNRITHANLSLLLLRNGRGLSAIASSNTGRFGYYANEFHRLIVMHISTGKLVGPLGLPRRLRISYLANFIFSLYIRRFLLLLNFGKINLLIRGVIPEFSSIWSLVNLPTEEVINNPISGELMLDFKLNPSSLLGKNTLDWLTDFLIQNDVTISSSLPEINRTLRENIKYIDNKASSTYHKTIFRYTLDWEYVLLSASSKHNIKKTPKLRNIKRRLAKKLVRRTQFRFWTL